MRRRSFIAGTALLVPASACASARSSAIDIPALSAEAVGSAASPSAKVEAVVDWTHHNLDWTGTDYTRRTVEEVLERGGGNCREQAMVVQALLAPAGVATRQVREINIQPPNPDRQQTAAEMVVERGPSASVFGLRHNDHVWIEFEDVAAGEWRPADPTIHLVDFEQWVTARMGFGVRPRHDVIPYGDMLFPIALAATTPDRHVIASRSRRYLIDAFGAYVPGVAASPHWTRWTELIATADPLALGAIEGRHNLHEDGALMDALTAIYEALRADAT